MPHFFRLFVAGLFLMFSFVSTGQAASANLYVGEAPVESQQASERRKAMPLALLQVLQKLSGLRFFDDYPLVADSLNDAEQLLVSFHYRNDEQSLSDGATGDNLKLVARFSEPAVNDLVQSLQLPLWRPERAPTEVWVIIDNGLDRQILPMEFQYAWDAMDAVAADRGLPISWPIADEDGQYPVDKQLLWGGYTEDLVGAGRGGVLVAAARREGPEWSVRLNLAYKQQNWTWRNRDVDLQFLLMETLEQAADYVSAANTIAASDRGRMIYALTVNGIGSADAYARCLDYLQNLSVVNRVSVESAQAGQVRYLVELNALPQYLEETLDLGRVLEPTDEDSVYLLNR